MFEMLKSLMAHLPKDEKGQDLTEYAMLVALIAIIVIVAVMYFGEQVSGFFSAIGATVATWW